MTYQERLTDKIEKLEKKWTFWGIVEFFSGVIGVLLILVAFAVAIFEFGFTKSQENTITLTIAIGTMVVGPIFMFSHWAGERYETLVESAKKRRR